ncbi:putative low-complexity protein [Carbonactinospora thermoautotrophica]|uniref:Putative low-complexity protein n=1 Tax=Carbonactinospora thermoautotrophica TaxID=1469144 RepID=A0A132MXI1_9ACTN|nr:pentapeptide repeat-containing protein [Carbonactinospora thermoautotrophica]KWX02559.1 putative low-complexity protein [Carbonactinospora thermoautotrophica]
MDALPDHPGTRTPEELLRHERTIENADFSGMDLRKLVGDPGEEPYVFCRCDFTEANLRGVNLRAAKFEDCRLAHADLTGAFLDETTRVGGRHRSSS